MTKRLTQTQIKLARDAARLVTARLARDQLVRDAYERGGGVREIARLVGLTHPAVRTIVRTTTRTTTRAAEIRRDAKKQKPPA